MISLITNDQMWFVIYQLQQKLLFNFIYNILIIITLKNIDNICR